MVSLHGRMKPSTDSYTIVIFRGHTAEPWRVSISRRFVRVALAIAASLMVGELALLSHYVSTTGEVWELRALREEFVSVRQQTDTFSSAVDDLKRRLLAMKEINHRLRVMLGVEEQRVQDPLNGQGGSEQPFGKAESSSIATSFASEASAGAADAGNPESTVFSLKLQRDISELRTAALDEERSLEELATATAATINRLAATPSVRPVEGWVTSGFGPRLSPFTNQLAMHDGLDIGAPSKTPVKSTAGGHVTAIGYDARMGNSVTIDHGHGIETQYGHLAKILVKAGQKVKRGDIIGLVGSTGLSTGPHLHYMVRVNDQAVNPERYILD